MRGRNMKRSKEIEEINKAIERIREESREAMRIAMTHYKSITEKRNKEILDAFLKSQRDNAE